MGSFDIGGVPVEFPDSITELRPHQPTAITEVVHHFATRSVVFLDAPTGAGKTIIGEGVRQMMHSAGQGMHRALYLCTTKSLQEQFLHDFRYARLIKGRANYPTLDEPDRFEMSGARHLDAGMCTRRKVSSDSIPLCDQCVFSAPDVSFDDEPTEVAHCHNCHPVQYCPYTVAKMAALAADLAVANTAYFLTEANGPGAFGAGAKGGKIVGYSQGKPRYEKRPKVKTKMVQLATVLGTTGKPQTYEKPEQGRCWHCHRVLEDRRSIEAGYGPVCAKNLGLEWGDGAPIFVPEWRWEEREYEDWSDTERVFVGYEQVPVYGEGKPKFGFFIIDEADTLESLLMSHIELSLSRYALRKLGLDPPRSVTKPESWLDWADKSFVKVAELSGLSRNQLNMYIEDPPPLDLRKETETLERLVGQFAGVVKALRVEPDNWVYDGEEGGVKLKPVTVSSHARSLLWRHGYKFLLMSATTISARQMADDLGLDEHEWEQVIVDSNFPIERRPVWVTPRANMTNKTKEVQWPKMVKGVEEILSLHPSERVLVHTHSYPLTEYLMTGLRGSDHGPRLLTYSEARGRDASLESFKNTPNGVLLAPSLDRGIDLPDDLCRVIIIAKVPFPNLGDKQVNKRFYGTYSGKGWFFTETVRSLVQMTGRGMRHENDYCISYILDAQFPSNIWTNPLAKHRIPRWWTAALKWEPPRRY